MTYCSAHFADLQRLRVTVRAKKKRKEKRFAQNWRIFRSNYAKRDNLNMPRIWREFSGNFLYWQNLRWQKIWFVVNYSTSIVYLFRTPNILRSNRFVQKVVESLSHAWVTESQYLEKKLMYVQKKYILLSAAEQEIFYSKDKICFFLKTNASCFFKWATVSNCQ